MPVAGLAAGGFRYSSRSLNAFTGRSSLSVYIRVPGHVVPFPSSPTYHFCLAFLFGLMAVITLRK